MFAGERLTVEKAERLCRLYFLGGFLFMPLLWFCNFLYFRRFVDQSDTIRRYVGYSLKLSIVGFAGIVLWYIIAVASLGSVDALWVIRPGVSHLQEGYFSNAIYNNL
jgi:hypothetical protein